QVVHVIHHTNETEPKPRALLAALEFHRSKSALVICFNSEECEFLARYLIHYGFKTHYCTQENNSQDVEQNLQLCANNSNIIFICQSDMLATHPLSNIPFVINYDMVGQPQVYEKLAHASEKTPRKIVSLVSNKELAFLDPIKAHCLIDFEELALPSSDEVLDLSARRLLSQLNSEAQDVELGQFGNLAQRMLAQENIQSAFALLLRQYLLKPNNTNKSESSSSERRDSKRRHEKDRRHEQGKDRQHRHNQKDDAPQESSDQSGITRLYITLGRQDDFHDLADLAQYLSTASGVDLGHFSGSGMIRDTSAHIEVDADVANKIIEVINNSPRPHASSEQEEGGELIVCERARQNTQRSYSRRPHHKRHGHFHRR
ncbi:MAG: hypothetical protein KC505_10150, partial [Myxococcales bacterium]|nr:hypothetical protein [Myxococcales bacterium]